MIISVLKLCEERDGFECAAHKLCPLTAFPNSRRREIGGVVRLYVVMQNLLNEAEGITVKKRKHNLEDIKT